MKLLTTVPARSDGTVVYRGKAVQYTFSLDPASGDLVCDVEEADVADLLATGNFEPADSADFDRADALFAESAGAEEDHDQDDDESAPGGLPVEALTPPVAKKKPTKAARHAH